MKRHVLDTSVVIKWFSEHGEDDLASALALRQGIIEGTLAVVVPDLLFYELASALRFNPRFSRSSQLQIPQSEICNSQENHPLTPEH